jgi:CelD/BcsL family acetyltransferase involved in cellulose biosynthesis
MRITRVTDTAQFLTLKEQWNILLPSSAGNTLFLTFEWLSTWWKVFGNDNKLCVLLVEDGNELVAIAPLYYRTRHVAGIPLCEIGLLGNQSVGSDFLGFIIKQGHEQEVLSAITEELKLDSRWDRIMLDDVDGDAAPVGSLRDLGRSCGSYLSQRPASTCPSMPLPATWDEFMAQPDKIFKRIVQRECVKKLHKRHQVELVISVDRQPLDPWLQTLFDLHTERWHSDGQPGAFDDTRMKEFYSTVSALFLQRGWLRLSALRVDGKVEVMEYGVVYGDAYYSLQGGCSARGLELKAGHVLQYHIFESLVGHLREFRFLRGAERYKYQWGCADKWTTCVGLHRGIKAQITGRSQHAARLIKGTIKGIMRRGRTRRK